MMRRFLQLLPVMLIIGFSACIKEPEPLSKQEIERRIDSMTKDRIKESDDMARRDLERRMKIEVKVKVDSIVKAQLQQMAKDTGKATPTGQPPAIPATKPAPAGNI
jgi:hypothetical protein